MENEELTGGDVRRRTYTVLRWPRSSVSGGTPPTRSAGAARSGPFGSVAGCWYPCRHRRAVEGRRLMVSPNQDVRIWNVQDRRKSAEYHSRPWVVRWRVGPWRFQRAFRTRNEADHLRSELLVAQRNGVTFDSSIGEPSLWRVTGEVSIHDWVRRWLGESGTNGSPGPVKGTVEEMSRFVPLVVKPAAADPPGNLRLYLKDALRPGAKPTIESSGGWTVGATPSGSSIDRSSPRSTGSLVLVSTVTSSHRLRRFGIARRLVRASVELWTWR